MTKDGLWDYVSTKLVATVTDAAANMVAGNKGFVNLLKKAIGKDDLITHKCLAHRLETVLQQESGTWGDIFVTRQGNFVSI